MESEAVLDLLKTYGFQSLCDFIKVLHEIPSTTPFDEGVTVRTFYLRATLG